MNKRLIAERFSKAITTYPKEANVQRQIAGKMIRLLTEHIPSPCSKVIEFGCGTGIYSRMLLQALRPEELLLNDLCPDMKYCCEDLLMKKQVSFLPGDAETVSFPTESTLITSCSALQWFESPENFFERCNTLLNNQGYFAFSTFGKENMKEIRELTGNGLPYRSREELEVALSPHFDILYSSIGTSAFSVCTIRVSPVAMMLSLSVNIQVHNRKNRQAEIIVSDCLFSY